MDFELVLQVGKRKVVLQYNVSLVIYRSVGKRDTMWKKKFL